MKAEEIRKCPITNLENIGGDNDKFAYWTCFMLKEIAAQLAEGNEHLETVSRKNGRCPACGGTALHPIKIGYRGRRL